MAKKKDLRNMNPDDLEKQLKDLKMELLKLNSQRASGAALKSPGQVKKTRKTIARIITIINEKNKNKPTEAPKKQ